MNNLELFPDDARSQSQTIGVILLTGVVVVVVSTTGMFYLSSIDSTADEPWFSVDGDFSRPNVTITHTGGNLVPAGELRLVLSVNGSRENATTLDREFEPGDRWRVNVSEYADISSESVAGVTVFHVPSESRKFSDEWSVGEERTATETLTETNTPTETATSTPEPTPTPTSTPAPTPTPTPEPDTTPPTVTVESPNGGETFVSGETATIEWSASDAESGVGHVDVEYSADDGASWNTVATDLDDTGSYDWAVPNVDSDEVLIRVTATDGVGNTANDTSDGTFTISQSGLTALSVTDLLSGESGQEQTLSFSVVGDLTAGEEITIDLSDAQAEGVDYRDASVDRSNAAFTTTGTETAVVTFTAEQDIASGETVSLTITGVETAEDYSAKHSVEFSRSDGSGTDTATFTVRLSDGDDIDGSDGDVYVDGDATLSKGGTVSGNVTASGSVTLKKESTVTGSIDAQDGVELKKETTVGGDINAEGDVELKKETTVSGDIDSSGKVELKKETTVGGDINSESDVELNKETSVSGNITASGDVELKKESTIEGDVTSEATVTLKKDSTVEGDVNVAGAEDIQCAKGATINGQPCSEYVDENY